MKREDDDKVGRRIKGSMNVLDLSVSGGGDNHDTEHDNDPGWE